MDRAESTTSRIKTIDLKTLYVHLHVGYLSLRYTNQKKRGPSKNGKGKTRKDEQKREKASVAAAAELPRPNNNKKAGPQGKAASQQATQKRKNLNPKTS